MSVKTLILLSKASDLQKNLIIQAQSLKKRRFQRC